jgi:hypothetical protein
MGKNKGGRPTKYFDEEQWKQFEQLCAIQCTKLEICDWFDIDDKSLEKYVNKRYNLSFSEVFRRKRTKGFISLRRKQYQAAMESGDKTLLIWLGKQWLGQTDKQEIEHSGQVMNDIIISTPEERKKRLDELKKKLNANG